ncbi:MAG: sugar transferase [Elusimicrobia bacterium]|nr:sugar transferase [Elusimicrobiota bacterium]
MAIKRCFDIVFSLAALIVLSPFFILAVILIRLYDGGSVFYCQERVGKEGKLFLCFKFRSMVVNAERMGLGHIVAKNDERITPVGRFMRRFSLDELPQLMNVLKGEMSLVGPRPTLLSQVQKYTDYERRRLEVFPGITGWAQVRGRNALSWNERIDLDVWYIEHWSFLLDLKILLLTIPALLSSESKLYGKNGVTVDF